MNILAVDDEKIMLNSLMRVLGEVFPETNIAGYQQEEEAIQKVERLIEQGETFTYAFLDVQIHGITGIDLAKQIKEKMPDIKILFCTAYSEYAYDAFQLFAIGYLLKPVEAEQVINTLDKMDKGWRNPTSIHKIWVQTFGNFEIYVDNKPMIFERNKAKELLAYLIDRKGATVTTSEISAILWEDEPYNNNQKNKTNVVISSLKKSAKNAGIEDILIKTWNHLAVDIEKLVCDRYEFEKGNIQMINDYHGEYMSNYSWAEFSNGYLQKNI